MTAAMSGDNDVSMNRQVESLQLGLLMVCVCAVALSPLNLVVAAFGTFFVWLPPMGFVALLGAHGHAVDVDVICSSW